jgi:hypothetical protein
MIKGAYRSSGLRQQTGIINNEIGLLDLVSLRQLGSDALPRCNFTEFVALQQSRKLGDLVDNHHQNQVDAPLGTGFEKQGRFINDQVMGGSLQSGHATFGQVGDGRMCDRLEPPPGSRVGKNLLCQDLAVEATARRQNLFPEDINQLCQRRTAGVDDFPGKEISADQKGAALDKHISYGTFSRGNAAGKAKNHGKDVS